MRTDTVILPVVAAALIDSAGHVLLQRRPADKAHGGLWEFPGGKIEAPETARQALRRELEEELGIDLAAERASAVAFADAPLGERTLILLLYACTEWTGDPVAREAGAAIGWFDPQAMARLAMPPADQRLRIDLARFLAT